MIRILAPVPVFFVLQKIWAERVYSLNWQFIYKFLVYVVQKWNNVGEQIPMKGIFEMQVDRIFLLLRNVIAILAYIKQYDLHISIT